MRAWPIVALPGSKTYGAPIAPHLAQRKRRASIRVAGSRAGDVTGRSTLQASQNTSKSSRRSAISARVGASLTPAQYARTPTQIQSGNRSKNPYRSTRRFRPVGNQAPVIPAIQPASQAECRGFDSRRPLHKIKHLWAGKFGGGERSGDSREFMIRFCSEGRARSSGRRWLRGEWFRRRTGI